MRKVRIVGRGRAGGSLARALRSVGWNVELVAHQQARGAARGVDLLVLAVPDEVVADVARTVEPVESTVVAHLAGALGLDVLAGHTKTGSVHPLVPLPNEKVGAQRLTSHAWFAVAGDPLMTEVVLALEGHPLTVDDDHRVAYHAAAVIASNHLVALLAQAERIAASAGLPLDAYLDLVRATVDNVAALGPREALTGPAARGDEVTIARHLRALPEEERALYEALSEACRRLAGCES